MRVIFLCFAIDWRCDIIVFHLCLCCIMLLFCACFTMQYCTMCTLFLSLFVFYCIILCCKLCYVDCKQWIRNYVSSFGMCCDASISLESKEIIAKNKSKIERPGSLFANRLAQGYILLPKHMSGYYVQLALLDLSFTVLTRSIIAHLFITLATK